MFWKLFQWRLLVALSIWLFVLVAPMSWWLHKNYMLLRLRNESSSKINSIDITGWRGATSFKINVGALRAGDGQWVVFECSRGVVSYELNVTFENRRSYTTESRLAEPGRIAVERVQFDTSRYE